MSNRAAADEVYDFVIVGSGFGGSVAALRLAERGYRVLVLERGRRFRDEDFARSTWRVRRYLWAPVLRCFGILQLSAFRDVWVLHGCGVGGGSLGYAGVLMEPGDAQFDAPGWRHLADWKSLLAPHFATARRMLGVALTPRLAAADQALRDVAEELGVADSFAPTPVGVFFGTPGREGEEVTDPYFGGSGPVRRSCVLCGGCMVGCRHNAKNTLPKNYLHLAERLNVDVRPESVVRDVRPLAPVAADGARYEVAYRSSTALLRRRERRVRTRNVIIAAGALGTLRLLLRARDVTRSLPALSPRLGHDVLTNSETILGSISRDATVDYSKGVAIGSFVSTDRFTTIEPVRYPAGSSLMRFLSAPLVDGGGAVARLMKIAWRVLSRPLDFIRTHVSPGWAQRGVVFVVMQTIDTRFRLRLGRGIFTAFRRDLVSVAENGSAARPSLDVGLQFVATFARRTNGIMMGSINDGLFGTPMTAHILGGCPIGRDGAEGVVDTQCRVHGYPGLFVIDGSVMPANPGVNPSLTIAAFAEYAMSHVPANTRS